MNATPANRLYRPYGAAEQLIYCKAGEVMLTGPAGTGKSRAWLEKLHLCAMKYPGIRALIARKTRASITQTAMVTYEEKVLPEGWLGTKVKFRSSEQEYRYWNGSKIVVGGLDKPTKIMSSEYDIIYVQEAIELSEDDWEKLTTRLRNGVMPYQQLGGDTNPDAPTHWLNKRMERGTTVRLESRHEDNPTVTPTYLAALDALTGVRKLRLRYGIWAAAEGLVYEEFDRATHLIPAFLIPAHWPRYWVVDFGFTNAFVWQAWAEDPDGRLYRYREIYRTQTLVQDHAAVIKELTKGEPRPRAVICDHDAEGRATLEKHLGITTIAAFKTVSEGIQAVQARLRVVGDGKPRLFLVEDSLYQRDENLDEKKWPASTEEEIDGYIWDTSNGRKRGEEPVKKFDHGMDTMRYMVAYKDCKPHTPFRAAVGGTRAPAVQQIRRPAIG